MASEKIASSSGAIANPIVFYDGECGLCNRSINWMIAHDSKGVLRFAPLQGETALNTIGAPIGEPSNWTIIYKDEGGVYNRSAAVLRIADRIGWGFGLPKLMIKIPQGLRDPFYKLVAKTRYKVFGKVNSCNLPSPEVRLKFLP